MGIIISSVVVLAVLAILVGATMPSKWNTIKKLVLGLLLVFSFHTLFGYLILPFHVQIASHIYLYIDLLLIVVVCIKLFVLDKSKLHSFYSWGKTDTVVVICTILLLGLLMIPTIKARNGLLNPSMPIGGDMSHHFAITNLIVQKGSYLYFKENLAGVLPTGLVDYPQAPHYNFAIIIGGNNQNDIAKTLRYFQYFYLFSYVFFFALFLNISLDFLTKKLRTPFGYLAVSISAILIFISTIFASLYSNGFLPQFFGLFVLLALVQTTLDQQKFKNISIWAAAIILLNALLAGTWYFITPIALVVSFLAFYRSGYRKNYLVYVLTLLGISLPIVASIIGSRSLGSINNPGAVDTIPAELLLLFGLSCLYVVWRYGYLTIENIRGWLELLLFSTLFVVLIAIFQSATTGHVAYYFVKSLSAPVLVLTMFYGLFIIIAAKEIHRHFSNLPRAFAYSMLALMITGSFFVLVYRPETRSSSLGLITKGSYLNSKDVSKIIAISSQAKPRGKNTILINTGSSLNDDVYATWVSALNLNFTPAFGELLTTDLNLADKYRRAGMSENLQPKDINLPNNSFEIVDFQTGRVVK